MSKNVEIEISSGSLSNDESVYVIDQYSVTKEKQATQKITDFLEKEEGSVKTEEW